MFLRSLSLLTVLTVSTISMPTGKKSGKRYDGFQLWRLNVTNDDQFQFLQQLRLSEDRLVDFWIQPKPTGKVEILVPPQLQSQLTTQLEQLHLVPTVLHRDLQKHIDMLDDLNQFNQILRDDSSRNSLFQVSQYHSYDEILKYMAALESRFPKLVTVITIGASHEKRNINLLRITSTSTPISEKRAIYLDGGMHAREWISPAVALYVINQLVENYAANAKTRELVDNLVWYILPVANPDGYEFTRANDRMWRKNRNPNGGSPGICRGVDLNRNFGFHFEGEGSSTSQCSDIYRGKGAFSEPESQAIQTFIQSRASSLDGFVTLHSYSQIWMHPYGHKLHNYPNDVDNLKNVALKATKRLESVYGTKYLVGTGADTLYVASGGSDDWAKGVVGIKYVYLVELRPADNGAGDGSLGFLLPENQIVPTGKETFSALTVIAEEILKKSPRVKTNVSPTTKSSSKATPIPSVKPAKKPPSNVPQNTDKTKRKGNTERRLADFV